MKFIFIFINIKLNDFMKNKAFYHVDLSFKWSGEARLLSVPDGVDLIMPATFAYRDPKYILDTKLVLYKSKKTI